MISTNISISEIRVVEVRSLLTKHQLIISLSDFMKLEGEHENAGYFLFISNADTLFTTKNLNRDISGWENLRLETAIVLLMLLIKPQMTFSFLSPTTSKRKFELKINETFIVLGISPPILVLSQIMGPNWSQLSWIVTLQMQTLPTTDTLHHVL